MKKIIMLLLLVLAGGIVFAEATISPKLLYKLDGAFPREYFGYSVSGAGDVNKDGYADFIVGAWGVETNEKEKAGAAYVFSGKDGSTLYTKTGEEAGDQFGICVSKAGDVNADGYADFIVGAFDANPYGFFAAGSAYVYSGADGELLYKKNGERSWGEFGYTVAGGGDVNADGYSDFMVGAWSITVEANPRAGAIYVYSGKDGSELYKKYGKNSGDLFGASISLIGDVNHDTFCDFIVGAFETKVGTEEHVGTTYVYSGINGRLLYEKNGEDKNDLYGYAVSGAGDVNADGYADFIVGALSASPNGLASSGSAYVYSGRDGTLLHQKDGEARWDFVGDAVSGAGDVNGDGYADFIIGASGVTVGEKSRTGGAYVYSGKDGDLLFDVYGEQSYDTFGATVSGAGDVNADGLDDVVVGAFWAAPNEMKYAGSAYVYSLR